MALFSFEPFIYPYIKLRSVFETEIPFSERNLVVTAEDDIKQ